MMLFGFGRTWCWQLITLAIVVCSASFLQVAGEDTKNAGTIKSVSRLVVVDTIVTDSSGQPLRGLKAEDFTVVEDGKPQKLALFSEEEPNTTTSAVHPPLPPNVFTNRPEYSNPTGALTVILLDGLNTPTQDQAYAREQLLKYLASQQDSTQRIAILALGNSLSLLQDFTSDPRILIGALKKSGIQLSAAPQEDLIAEPLPTRTRFTRAGNEILLASRIQATQQFLTPEAFNMGRRIDMTLQAMRLIARALGGYPGRKKLIWISAAFPAVFSHDIANKYGISDSYIEEIRRTDNLLTDAQVAVYPVDARGFVVSPSNNIQNWQFAPWMGRAGGWFYSSQASMQEIAEDTGGRAFMNQNEIHHAIATSVNEGNHYYALAYVPENKKWDGRFRKIKVEVRRNGASVRARRGYYATDIADTRRKPQEQHDEILAALAGGTLPATMVVFDARVVPSSGQAKVPVDVRVDPRTVLCDSNGGGRHCNLEFHVAAFSGKGKRIAHDDQRFDATIPEAVYQKLGGQGLPFHADLELPSGDYLLRFAIRDNATGSIGTLEAPLALAAR